MIEKPSQATIWSQFNMWSLTNVDSVPFLTCLPVLGNAPWCSETRTFMSVSFTVIGSCAAFAHKFIDKIRLQDFRNTVFKSKIVIASVTCLQSDFKLTKFQALNKSVQSLLVILKMFH